MAAVCYRPRDELPHLTQTAELGDVVLDTNVFINALAGRGPPVLKALLGNLPGPFVSGSTLAELNWPRGRLDPVHPNTGRVLTQLDQALARIDPDKVLAPASSQ